MREASKLHPKVDTVVRGWRAVGGAIRGHVFHVTQHRIFHVTAEPLCLFYVVVTPLFYCLFFAALV